MQDKPVTDAARFHPGTQVFLGMTVAVRGIKRTESCLPGKIKCLKGITPVVIPCRRDAGPVNEPGAFLRNAGKLNQFHVRPPYACCFNSFVLVYICIISVRQYKWNRGLKGMKRP